MKINLRLKVIVLVFTIGFLPLLAVIGMFIMWFREAQRQHAVVMEAGVTEVVSKEIGSFIISQFTVLKNIATTHTAFSSSKSLGDMFLERSLFTNNDFVELSIVDDTGREVSRKHTLLAVMPQDLTDRSGKEEFLRVKEQVFYLGPVYFVDGRPRFMIGMAMGPRGDSFAGAIFAVVDARILQDVITKVSAVRKGGRAYMVDGNGRVIAHPDISFALAQRDFSELPVVRRVVHNNPSIDPAKSYFNEFEEEVIGAGARIAPILNGSGNLDTGWFVIAEMPREIAMEAVETMTRYMEILLLSVFLLAGGAAIAFARRITAPLGVLVAASQALGRGDINARAMVHTRDEIQDVAHAFNIMAERLGASIADLKKEQEVIAAERNKIEVALSGITDGVIAVDFDRRIILLNKATETLLGVSASEAMGKYIADVMHLIEKGRPVLPEEYVPARKESIDRIVFTRRGLRLVNAAGHEHFVDVIAGQIKEGAAINLGYILTLHDVSRETFLDRIKSNFVAIAAHQLRTPLTVIKWALDDFFRPKTKINLPDPLAKEIRVAFQHTERMIKLVNELLDVVRIEEGRVFSAFQRLDIKTLIQTSVNNLKEKAKQKNIALQISYNEGIPPDIYADSGGLLLVFENLIDNAILYSHPGGNVSIECSGTSEGVTIAVRDQGIGIPPDLGELIFTKFFRGREAMLMETEGSGLGLFICKNIVEAQNGKIWFESEQGQGSSFYVFLPRVGSAKNSPSVRAEYQEQNE